MMQTHPQIKPDWSLARLKEEYPGVEMVLFSSFGVGSRERSGFAGREKLEELLRRHLIFDHQKACEKLNQLAAEDRQHQVEAGELRRLLEQGVRVLDARGPEEFERASLSGSVYLSHQTVKEAHQDHQQEIVTVCRDGSQAPAASRVLRSQGLSARHLKGGLESWSLEVDADFPVQFALQEAPGRWYLLADGETLRYRRPRSLPERKPRLISRRELEQSDRFVDLLRELPELQTVISSQTTFAVRGLPRRLPPVIARLPAPLRESPEWETMGTVPTEIEERAKLEEVLAREAPVILGNHKGTVEVDSYCDRILTLRLGGQCAGCASAEITTQRELAAALYREVPLLDQIRSVESE
ncbi:MAG: rhodanese-like domain-containing protein [Vulcanimicrobiota bacterium]